MRFGNKGSMPVLLISKMKATRYPYFGLELLVPEHMWIEDVCTYDISAKYGIAYWWFNRQKFYIDRHDSPSHRKEVQTHMRILSVVRIKAYSRYGLESAPSTRSSRSSFWFRQMDVIRGSQVMEPKLRWDAIGYEFKHDYTIIESPQAVIFPVNKNERKIMRFNEIYRFSDDTLTHISETLDYRVKEFKIKRLNSAIERRLKTRRIYRNLECFVGGRVRDIGYRLLRRTE
ncbi:hypothetical protein Tco_1094179 [Tanacetum coccineum]|uniref:Uncharacterized protein n=1 Tax=Tanacetum coccineum TaxID=301880 RepID=A0ABQ5IET0_9ASTR